LPFCSYTNLRSKEQSGRKAGQARRYGKVRPRVEPYGKIDGAMSQYTLYYEKLAAAFVRGKLHNDPVRATHPALFATALAELSEDDNPEHIHLFDEQSLRQRFQRQGITHISFDYVPGHIIAIARINKVS
jgi:hypothetical protein